MSFGREPRRRVWYFKDGFVRGRFHKHSPLICLSPIRLISLPVQFLRGHLRATSFSSSKIAFTFGLFSLPLFLSLSLCLSLYLSLVFPLSPFHFLSLWLCLSLSICLPPIAMIWWKTGFSPMSISFLWYHLRHACNLPWLSPWWQEEQDELLGLGKFLGLACGGYINFWCSTASQTLCRHCFMFY